jgi:hypothetical protein
MGKPTLNSASENENEHNDQHNTKNACRKRSPCGAIGPGGNSADKENDQNYEEYCSEWHVVTSWLRRPRLEKAPRVERRPNREDNGCGVPSATGLHPPMEDAT